MPSHWAKRGLQCVARWDDNRLHPELYEKVLLGTYGITFCHQSILRQHVIMPLVRLMLSAGSRILCMLDNGAVVLHVIRLFPQQQLNPVAAGRCGLHRREVINQRADSPTLLWTDNPLVYLHVVTLMSVY